MRVRIASLFLAGLASMSALAAVAFAQQVRPIDVPRPRPPIVVPRPTLAPGPQSTLPPAGRATPAPVAGGQVPISALPPLPPQTAANTVTPAKLLSHVRTASANGASIDVTATTATTGCATLLGDNFPIGCTPTWQSSGLPTTGPIGTPKYQDYYILPNTGTATTQNGTYNGPTGAAHTRTLTAGVTVFATYDTKNQYWATVTYVTAGNPTAIRVYQDPFFSEESYQYDVSSSGDAYIHITNLSATDSYVVSIEQTSVGPNCVFSAPAESPTPAANALCNAENSPGSTAAGGALNVTWPILNTYAAGTYAIILYDRTLDERLGEVQVSLTGSAGNTLSLSTSVSSANTTTAPSPAPEGAGGIRSVFAWDDANEQSISGVTLGAAAVPSGNYEWSFNDPIGETTGAAANGISGVVNHTFDFAGNIQTPGQYPASEFSAALMNASTKTVYAAQAFRVLAYAAKTTFHSTSDVAALSISPGSSTTSTLKLLNNGDYYYGTNNGDPLAGLAFSTGSDFTATAGTGYGVEMALSGFTLAQCAKAAGGCSTTVTGSGGNSWTVRDYCSDVSPNTTSACYLVVTPVVTSAKLAVDEYIDIPSIKFYGASGFSCTASNCEGLTSVLPYDGVKWSRTDVNEAWSPVYFNSSGSSVGGTGHVYLYGAYVGNTTYTTNTPEAHLYPSRFTQSVYEQASPYVITGSGYMNIWAITINNTSTSTKVKTFAFQIPGPVDSTGYIQLMALGSPRTDQNWRFTTTGDGYPGGIRCIDPNVRIDCLTITGSNSGIAAGSSMTMYIGLTAPPGSFPYTDWSLFSVADAAFAIPADGTTNVPVSNPSLSVDTLALAGYSLNGSYMGAQFNPSSAGTGATSAESFLLTNTTMAADPFPDYVDAVILAVPTSVTVSGTPTVSNTGWSYIGNNTVGSFHYYWFGVCSGQYNTANEPATSTPLGSTATAMSQCTTTQESHSLAPGDTLTTNFTFTGLTTGTLAFNTYAHGANDDGWTTAKEVDLPVTSVSASAGFTKAGTYGSPPSVATNTIPTIGGNSDATYGNSFVYTIKNTSNSTAITQATITVPGLDINGVNATDSSGDFWTITATPTLSYSGGATSCTVSTQNATAAGADGYIKLGGGSCSIAAGKTMTITFAAKGPQSQNDQYVWTTTVNNGAATAGETWLGDTRIQVQLSIGLDVVVNPSNPGPGDSTPSISCSGCSFAGSTVDFGTVGSGSTASFLDTARASVYITSATVVNWTLSVSTSLNPANSTGSPTNELQTSVDSANSSSGAGMTFDQTSYAVIPTAGSLQIVHGSSITSRTKPYDVVQNFRVSMGNESVTPNAATITYTLVAN